MVPGSRLRSLASHLRAAPRPAAASEQEVDEDGPLAGMLVVEWTTAIQGPAAGQYLRDMGAEVIKIEGPTGDGNRHGRGTQNDTPRVGLEPQFVSCNLGKKSLSVDVKHPESLEVINKLLDKADVFLANFTQRALDDLGLGYEVLKARNPGLVYAVRRTAPHRTPPPTRCHLALKGERAAGVLRLRSGRPTRDAEGLRRRGAGLRRHRRLHGHRRHPCHGAHGPSAGP